MDVNETEAAQCVVAELLAEHHGRIAALIRVLLPGDASSVDDVFQNTCERALEKAAQYDAARPGLPWLKAIAVSEVLQHFRRKRRARVLFDSETLDRLVGELAEDAEKERFFKGEPIEDCLKSLRTCIGKQSGWGRKLLEERYVSGKPVGKIASDGGVSRVSVSVALLRLRRSLRECMDGLFRKRTSKPFDNELAELMDGEMCLQSARMLSNSPEMRKEWIGQIALHSLLMDCGSAAFPGRVRKSRWRIAAAAVLAISAAIAWCAIVLPKKPVSVKTPEPERIQTMKLEKAPAIVAAAVAFAAGATSAETSSKTTASIAIDTRNADCRALATAVDARNTSSVETAKRTLNTEKPVGTVIYLI